MSTGRHVVAVMAVCALGLCAATTGQAQTQEDPPKVDELLERFPIGTDTVTVTEAEPRSEPGAEAERATPPPAITVPETGSDGDSPFGLIAAVGVAVLLAAAAAGAVLFLRRRRERMTPIWQATPNLALLYQTLANTDQEWDKLQPADQHRRRSAPVTEVTHDPSNPQPDVAAEARDGDTPETLEHVGVVEHISAILQSAEAAAAAIRSEAGVKADEITTAASAKAEEIKRAAAEEAQKHLAQVKEEAARLRNDAEVAAKESQSAAESYGAKQRREAEERVQQILGQAEGQARATRQAAEEMAKQIEEAAKQRAEKIKAQVQPLETSLRRALDGFRGITAQLEDLLGPDTASQQEETLVGVLNESAAKRAGEWEETQQQKKPVLPPRERETD
jgi:hypothetical protein